MPRLRIPHRNPGILNDTNFLDPATAAGSSTFGRITGAMDPRIGQLSVRFIF